MKVRLKAIAVIPRIAGRFELKNCVYYRNYGFKGFKRDCVSAFYRLDDSINGYGVCLVLQPSQVDRDFGANVFFASADLPQKLLEAFKISDELTHKILGHGWTNSSRPFLKMEDFI